MTDLHEVSTLMVQLRQAVSRGVRLVKARLDMETLQKKNETGALPSEVKSVVRWEQTSCEQFVSCCATSETWKRVSRARATST